MAVATAAAAREAMMHPTPATSIHLPPALLQREMPARKSKAREMNGSTAERVSLAFRIRCQPSGGRLNGDAARPKYRSRHRFTSIAHRTTKGKKLTDKIRWRESLVSRKSRFVTPK